MTKQELRKLYRDKRNGLETRDRLRFDDMLLLQFQQFNYEEISKVLTYWPMPHTAEPNTHIFSAYLRHMVAGISLAYPKTDLQTCQMDAFMIDEDSIYTENKWGITEPKDGQLIKPTEIDLIFVPMLICDLSGQRVGYGKGFYDRYLARCRKNIVKIGFSYFEPVEQVTDTGPFDVPLNYCITPEAIYEF